MAVGHVGAFARAVACAVRLGCLWRLWRLRRFFMARMVCRQGAVVLALFLGLRMLYLSGRHLRGHRVAHPAAQRQQGNQKGEEQVAHGDD